MSVVLVCSSENYCTRRRKRKDSARYCLHDGLILQALAVTMEGTGAKTWTLGTGEVAVMLHGAQVIDAEFPSPLRMYPAMPTLQPGPIRVCKGSGTLISTTTSRTIVAPDVSVVVSVRVT